ncbi:MAG: class D sortase [Clostridia bacterium]|nr:class D sortase [Clostridia bacterium]
MKKKTLKRVFSVCICILFVFFIILYTYIQFYNQRNHKNLLNIANNIVSQNIVNSDHESHSGSNNPNNEFIDERSENQNNVIGKIIIKDINVEAPIVDGTSQESLKVAVGHIENTDYWNGNVCLASHNRGSFAHYFENIDKLKIGDEIVYQTKLGAKVYSVSSIEQIEEHNVSVLESTERNTLTLITCIRDKSDYRLCVKAVEKMIQN